MTLLTLRGTHFRNISELNLSLSPTVNIIYGHNGSGKSTLLEMIYCLNRGRSFRTHLAAPIIQNQQDQCTVFGKILQNNQMIGIGFQKARHGKTMLKVTPNDQTPTLKNLSN